MVKVLGASWEWDYMKIQLLHSFPDFYLWMFIINYELSLLYQFLTYSTACFMFPLIGYK